MAFRILSVFKRNRTCNVSSLSPVCRRIPNIFMLHVGQYHTKTSQPTPEEWASFQFDDEPNPFRFYPDHIPEIPDIQSTPMIRTNKCHKSIVLYGESSGVRTIILNRNHLKNRLNARMLRKIIASLEYYQQTNEVHAIIIRSSAGAYTVAPLSENHVQRLLNADEETYFCTGTDLVNIWKMQKKEPKSKSFFSKEFNVASQISKLTTPFVAYMDGHMTGCGIGFPMAARYRVCSPDATIHFPELHTGFIPHCGASFFLSRLPHHLGRYLALTGATLRGYDLIHAGLATHFMPQRQFNYFTFWLTQGSGHRSTVMDMLEICDQSMNSPQPFSLSKENLSIINECFCHDNVWKIITALEVAETTYSSDQHEFIQGCLKGIQRASPTNLNITLEMIVQGKKYSLDKCLKMEYGLIQEVLNSTDFNIGMEESLCDGLEVPIWSKKLDQNDKDWLKMFENAKRHHLEFSPPSQLANQHILDMTDTPQPEFSHDPQFAECNDFKRTWR